MDQLVVDTPLPHVLVVDDDRSIRESLANYLGASDLRVSTVGDGSAMGAALGSQVIDLLILDLRLGAENGLDIARRLREGSAIPILVVSGRTDEADRVMALELGADDYLTKPFSPRELLARIRALLRRRRLNLREQRGQGVRAYRFDGCELNMHTRQLLARGGEHVRLSPGEFSLLVALLGARGRILSRAQLLERSRVHDDEVFDRAVDVLVMRLRRKLGEDRTNPRWIVTVRGGGYRFGVPVEVVY